MYLTIYSPFSGQSFHTTWIYLIFFRHTFKQPNKQNIATSG